MKILSPPQIKALDEFTIKNEPINSWDLMERAAANITDYLLQHYPNKVFYVFCGNGNNGGDGLAVSRLLQQTLHTVHCYYIYNDKNSTTDTIKNLKLLQELDSEKTTPLKNISQFPKIDDDVVILDALFGTGLNRPLNGFPEELVLSLNKLNNTLISIDMPSGLMAEKSPLEKQTIIKASETLSFQMPKLTFLFQDCYEYVGQWTILDIGLSNSGIASSKTSHHFVDKTMAKSILKERHQFAHKGDFGHALLIAGSYGKMGAAVLASKACLKSGVGLLTSHIPHWGYQIMQTSVPEAMVSIDRSEMYFTEFPELDAFAAVGVGPGLNTKSNSIIALSELLKNNTKPLVIDADALNIIATNTELLQLLGEHCILTPHPGEFKRLVGDWTNDEDKLIKLKDFCKQYKCTTVLKGAYSVTCLPNGDCYFNSTGNPGMASAGSGDILTGIILSLLSQKYTCTDASILGVYLHGLAANLALNTESQESLIASDIINNLANAFKNITSE